MPSVESETNELMNVQKFDADVHRSHQVHILLKLISARDNPFIQKREIQLITSEMIIIMRLEQR